MRLSGPRLKLLRRLGTPLPGLTRKEAGEAPVPRGRPPRRSPFRRRLEEKQKVRAHYGVSERQLRAAFDEARRHGAAPGGVLLALLELRLDNVVFRLGLAPTIPAARQLVAHGHIRVNGRRLDRASARLVPGDVVAVSARGRRIPAVQEAAAEGPQVRLPGFLARDPGDVCGGRVLGQPERPDVPFLVDESAIVEHYAR